MTILNDSARLAEEIYSSSDDDARGANNPQQIPSPNLEDFGDDVDNDDDLLDESGYSLDPKFDENFLPKSMYDNYMISGWGEQTKESCARIRRAYITPHKRGRHSNWHCHQQGCPKCFRDWAKRQSKMAANEYLWLIHEAASVPLFHYSFSPKPETFSTFTELVKRLKAFVSDMVGGADTSRVGYAIVAHPYSIKCAVCNTAPRSHRLPYRCPNCAEYLPWMWVKQPHLHVITNFHFAYELTNKFVNLEDKYGVIFKGLTRDKVFGIVSAPNANDEVVEGSEILRRILAYEFGHARWQPPTFDAAVRSRKRFGGHPVITYHGYFSRKFWRRELLSTTQERVLSKEGEPYRSVKYEIAETEVQKTRRDGTPYTIHHRSWKPLVTQDAVPVAQETNPVDCLYGCIDYNECVAAIRNGCPGCNTPFHLPALVSRYVFDDDDHGDPIFLVRTIKKYEVIPLGKFVDGNFIRDVMSRKKKQRYTRVLRGNPLEREIQRNYSETAEGRIIMDL